jgi:type IV secretion system protein VirD4
VISTCDTQTAWLEGEAMKSVLQGSDFRLEELKDKRVTVYLCLPAMRLGTHGRWLRLMIGMALEALERTGPIKENQQSKANFFSGRVQPERSCSVSMRK